MAHSVWRMALLRFRHSAAVQPGGDARSTGDRVRGRADRCRVPPTPGHRHRRLERGRRPWGGRSHRSSRAPAHHLRSEECHHRREPRRCIRSFQGGPALATVVGARGRSGGSGRRRLLPAFRDDPLDPPHHLSPMSGLSRRVRVETVVSSWLLAIGSWPGRVASLPSFETGHIWGVPNGLRAERSEAPGSKANGQEPTANRRRRVSEARARIPSVR